MKKYRAERIETQSMMREGARERVAGEGETEISKSRQKESTHNIEEMFIISTLVLW